VNPLTGENSTMIGTHVCTALMSLHLRWVSEQAGPRRHIVLVLDQAGWHVSGTLEVPTNITLLFLPPYSPELNPVERLWLWMKEHLLSNRVYADVPALMDAGRDAFNSLTDERVRTVCGASWVPHTN
jgi:transposase